MPVIMIHTLELTEEQKKRIAKKYTKILSEETNVPEERIYAFFCRLFDRRYRGRRGVEFGASPGSIEAVQYQILGRIEKAR